MTTNDDSLNNIKIIVVVAVVVVVLIILLIVIVLACKCTRRKREYKTSLEFTNASAIAMCPSPACSTHHEFSEAEMDHLNGPTVQENTTTFHVQLVNEGYIIVNNANETIGQSDATREDENVEEYVGTLNTENQGHNNSTVEEEEHI